MRHLKVHDEILKSTFFDYVAHFAIFYRSSLAKLPVLRINFIYRSLSSVEAFKMFCGSSSGQGTSAEAGSGGPTVRRQSEFNPETTLNEDECKEAIAFMSHSSDEDTIKKKMKLTFDYRRNMVLDPMQSSDILTVFPRFKDIKGLVKCL